MFIPGTIFPLTLNNHSRGGQEDISERRIGEKLRGGCSGRRSFSFSIKEGSVTSHGVLM